MGSNEVGRERATWLVKANQRTQYYRGHTSLMRKVLAAYIQSQSPMKTCVCVGGGPLAGAKMLCRGSTTDGRLRK